MCVYLYTYMHTYNAQSWEEYDQNILYKKLFFKNKTFKVEEYKQ